MLGHVFRYLHYFDLVMMLSLLLLVPVLCTMATCFAIRDLRRCECRWQAVLALAASCLLFALNMMVLKY